MLGRQFTSVTLAVGLFAVALSLSSWLARLHMMSAQPPRIESHQGSVWVMDDCAPLSEAPLSEEEVRAGTVRVQLCASGKFQGYVITWPERLASNSTGELRFWVDPQAILYNDERSKARASIEIFAPDVKGSPVGPIALNLGQSSDERVLITSKEVGPRKILIRSTVSPAPEGRVLTAEPYTLDISIASPPLFLGMSAERLQIMDTICKTIGIPAILLAVFNFWMMRRERPKTAPAVTHR